MNGSSSGELTFMMCDKFLEMQGPFQMEDKKARLWLNSLDMEFQVYNLLKLIWKNVGFTSTCAYDMIYIYMYKCMNVGVRKNSTW